jgi:hypothetical protein
MKNFLKNNASKIVAGAVLASAIAPLMFVNATTFDTAGATSIFGTELSNLQTMLYTNIPLVLEIGFALVGLGIAIHYVRKWIGRKA